MSGTNLTGDDKSVGNNAQQSDNLPVKKGDDFIGEFEVMDLTKIKNKQFFIGVAQGEREKGKMLSTTIKGPYTFYEMLEEVGVMYKEHQHHAAVYFANKDRNQKNEFLDRNTVDYIEANWEQLITEGLLSGAFDGDDVEYTCQAGINEASTEGDPRFEEEEDA